MREVIVDTVVNSPLYKVIEGFDEVLFLSLAPPFPRVKLVQFDGCKTGDSVKIQLDFIFIKSEWEARIIDDNLTDNEWYFIDEAIRIPFPFKSWKHQHRVTMIDDQSCTISDHIHYSTGNGMADLMVYPFVQLLFKYRKPVYRRYFNNRISELNP
jgi:ligand-binding SRPBCC domain-containing protein